jgi:hypothetical protein
LPRRSLDLPGGTGVSRDAENNMVKKAGETEVLRCSFCNKDQNDVRKLIAGPTVFICDECVGSGDSLPTTTA